MVRLAHEVLMHPYVTEKTLMQMENENKLEFVVHPKATKPVIKKAFEQRYGVKIDKVTTKRVKDGKHAIIRFAEGYHAEDVGMRIGIF